MLGSYGPQPYVYSDSDSGSLIKTQTFISDPYVKNFPTEESPSGMVARSGTYNVRSRVIDDDKEVYAGPYTNIDHKLITLVSDSIWN